MGCVQSSFCTCLVKEREGDRWRERERDREREREREREKEKTQYPKLSAAKILELTGKGISARNWTSLVEGLIGEWLG